MTLTVIQNEKKKLSNIIIRYWWIEWKFSDLNLHKHNKILNNKSTLQRLADESWVSYTKHEWWSIIDDALSELKEINSNKKWAIKEHKIKIAKREQIKDIIYLIDEWLWWEWNYWRFFDMKYQWTPTIIFRKWNDLVHEVYNNNIFSFHQPKNRKWYEHVPTWRLPISPIWYKKSK